MIVANKLYSDNINSPVRTVKAKVELYNGATLADTFKDTDKLKSFTVERVGEDSKSFGFGICQKANIKIVDHERILKISAGSRLELYLGFGVNLINPLASFYVTEVHRNENSNELSVTAYDKIYAAAGLKVADLNLSVPYDIKAAASGCASALGLTLAPISDIAFNTSYPAGANFSGEETVREFLNDIAEATQTIYYVNEKNQLTFKRLDKDGNAVEVITREKYFTLKSGENKRLSKIMSVTDLGDNVEAALTISGYTQYVRNNGFWTMREDIGELLNSALASIGGITMNQFDCKWRGNFLVELGDKIGLQTKDGKITYCYLLNDTIRYDGTMSQDSRWNYIDDTAETESNSASLGQVLNDTFARVDKANKKIEILAKETEKSAEELKQKISKIEQDANGINASVSRVEEQVKSNTENTNAEIQKLTDRVNASMTAEDVKIQIQKELDNGVEQVTTATGFTFNQEGMKVSKSDSEMETQITEDGMTITRSGQEVLTARNNGVDAENLHATTYLIIGKNSRFEDFGTGRTGCFWIG